MRDIDQYFAAHDEPVRGCLAFLRDFILHYDNRITEGWRYSMPFYFVDGKRFAYLWTDKKTGCPYIGIVDGIKIDQRELIQEKRTRMKNIFDRSHGRYSDTQNKIVTKRSALVI